VASGEKNKTKSSGSYPKPNGPRKRASSVREKPKKKIAVYVFWLFFFILIVCLFIVNMDAIQTSLRNTGVIDHLLNRPVQEQDILPPEGEVWDDSQETVLPRPPSGTEEHGTGLPAADEVPDTVSISPPASETPAVPYVSSPAETSPVPQERTGQPVVQPAPRNPPEIRRERALYFIRVDPDGTIVRTRVTRDLPVTDSPLVDVLNILLQGPSAGEKSQGLISLIPGGTRLLSATTVRGSTAYINFNENFLFNEYGVEGYAGQLRQIVWTVTEFSNVKDVQILIEGRRIDYLGESVWIGSPIGRESY
jgi:spore germination protein GerM